MQRKRSPTTRHPNAAESRFMLWIKEQDCCSCHKPGPSICDHMYGSTFKHNKVLVGHWALLPYCQECDTVKTIHGRKAHNDKFGFTQAELWDMMITEYTLDEQLPVPFEVIQAIADWGR